MVTKQQTKVYNKKYHQEHKEQAGLYSQRYYQSHKEQIKTQTRKYSQEHKEQFCFYNYQYREKLRFEVLTHYSGGKPQCAICGEPDPLVLAIDHIEGGGNQHRKSIGRSSGDKFYCWLRQQNFPRGFQVLCPTCNTRKYRLEQIAQRMEKLNAERSTN